MEITREKLIDAGILVLKRSLMILPADMLNALEYAIRRESHPQARQALKILFENARSASEKKRIICQDTGFPCFLVSIGQKTFINCDVYEAFKAVTEHVTKELSLIACGCHPITRENPGTNVGLNCPVIHVNVAAQSDEVVITAKPISAIEGKCAIQVFDVTARPIDLDRFLLHTVSTAGSVCPPLVVGIGLGSSMDNAGLISLIATLRSIGTRNPDPHIATLEERWTKMVNQIGMGCMNLGGDVSALAVHIEGGFTHQSHTIMAIRTECWCNRQATVTVQPDGTISLQ